MTAIELLILRRILRGADCFDRGIIRFGSDGTSS